jgi:DNA adenine methylase
MGRARARRGRLRLVSTLPPFAYYGGKSRLAPRIVELLPPHDHYVEPFAGSMAVLLAKRPSLLETVNDIDGELMLFWRILRDRPADLARVCALTPHGRAEHIAARDLDGAGDDDLERARRVWVLLSQGRTGTMRITGWRHYITPSGSNLGMPGYLEAYLERIIVAAERLHAVSLECMPALELIERYDRRGVLFYIDPPYLGDARSTDADNYRMDMRGEPEHRDLAAALNACGQPVVLSGYHSPLYDELYDGWHVRELAASTGQGIGERTRVEVLWSNRPFDSDARLFA